MGLHAEGNPSRTGFSLSGFVNTSKFRTDRLKACPTRGRSLSSTVNDGPRFALHNHAARKLIVKHGMPRRPRLRIGKHRHPFLVDLGPNLGSFNPYRHTDHIFGRRSGSCKDDAQIRKHVDALRGDVVRNFARARVRPGYPARRHQVSDARNRGNRIGMPQSLNVERFSFAHDGAFLPAAEFGRRPIRPGKNFLEIRIVADERGIIMSRNRPMQLRPIFRPAIDAYIGIENPHSQGS